MLTIQDIQDFKIERRRIQLPKPENNKGNLIFLPYLTPEESVKAIRNTNRLFNRSSFWKMYFRDYRYTFKLFNKVIRYNNLRERNEILDSIGKADSTIKPIRNFMLSKGKNCYIDISYYFNNFFNFRRSQYKLILSQFFNMLNEIINNEAYNEFNKKYLIIDVNEWGISNIKNIYQKNNILNNPLSILYLGMKKTPEEIKALGDCEFIITDNNIFFKFNPSRIDKDAYMDFKLSLSKIKSNILSSDLDNDNHLTTYGAISSSAPASELNKAKLENEPITTDQNVDGIINDEEKEEKDILDKIHDFQSKDEDHEEVSDDQEEIEDNIEDEEEKDKSENQEEKSDKDEDDLFEDEFEDQLSDEDVAQQLQDYLSNKVPDSTISRREQLLKEHQKQIKLESGKTLRELLDDVKNNPSYIDIPKNDVSDKVTTTNVNVTKVSYPNFEKVYNDKVFEHDFYSIFDSLSERKDLPIFIRKISKEDTSDSLNLKETYKIELEDAEYGRRHTFTIDVPKMLDGKFMYLAGNKKIFIKQLILKPIVKIAPDTVQICSNYSKIFMYRYGENISPKVQNISNLFLSNPSIFKVKTGNSVPFNKEYKTTIEYDQLAKKYMEISFKNSKRAVTYLFSQELVNKFIEEHKVDVSTIDRDKFLIIGFLQFNKEKDLWMPLTVECDAMKSIMNTGFNNGPDLDPEEDNDDIDNTSVIDSIINQLKVEKSNVDIDKLLVENGLKFRKTYVYSRCKIMKKYVPTILLLGYFEGLQNALLKAKINYTFSEERPKLSNVDKMFKGVIQFTDGYLVFDRYPLQNSLLMNAFSMIDTKSYSFQEMNSKGAYIDIFGNLFNSRILASAFDAFYDNMIDPITKEILESMNYPTDLTDVLIFANDLLTDNNYSSEINMNNFRVRSNEMINAMLYKIVANAYSKYKRTAKNRSPIKISVPKTALLKELLTSQSVEDYSTLNPILEVDKSRAITAKGPSGINLDQSYTEEKRSFDKTMTGLMSVSTNPDGNTGVVKYLTMEPKITSPRGFIDTTKPIEQMTDANVFSPGEMVSPLGVTRDDSIRTAMASKQTRHLIPVRHADPVLVTNGAEKVLPYHLSDDFSVVAEHDGKVISFDEKTQLMIIEYKWKEGKETKTSHKVINLAPQISKNGGGGFYLANTLKPYFKVGQSFKKNDILTANSKFFGNYADGVKFNLGTLCKIACMSDYNTFEDSTVISEQLSNRMTSEIIIPKDVRLGKNANLIKLVKPGDKVSVNDDLIVFEQSNKDESINKLLANIGEELQEEVSNLNKNAIKSKYTGYIADVKIYSVSPLEELSPSLKKVVGDYWKQIKDKKDVLKKYNITNPDDMGNIFMDSDEPIVPINGKIKGFNIEDGVLILIYIAYQNKFGIGDKLINYSALKGVCSELWDEGKEPFSEYRPDEQISALLPFSGIAARMTPSVLFVMFANKLLIELKRHLADIYFGKGKYDYTQDLDYKDE